MEIQDSEIPWHYLIWRLGTALGWNVDRPKWVVVGD